MTRLGFTAIDAVRRRVQQQTHGHRGHKHDPLCSIRRLLRRGYEHHTERSWARLLAGLDAGDVDGEVGAAWIGAQDLRLIFHCPTRDQAEQALFRWFCRCADAGVPELVRLAPTIDNPCRPAAAPVVAGRVARRRSGLAQPIPTAMGRTCVSLLAHVRSQVSDMNQ